jgi:aspartate racemase
MRLYNQKMVGTQIQAAIPNRMIGILGGMGPEATLDLYRTIIHLTPAKRDQDHIQVLIHSNPKIPDRTEAIAQHGESPLPYLIESAKILEQGGAGIIAMPCNAAHHYLPEIRRHISIPFIDMIEETCGRIRVQRPNCRTVGLIATIGTVLSGVYPGSLTKAGIAVRLPSHEDQQRIQVAIDQIKAGVHDRSTQETLQSIGAHMAEAGAESIILGCTEIPLAFNPDEVNYLTLNPTRILAEVAVEWALAQR